jgi:biopolymer transport protein ExbD
MAFRLDRPACPDDDPQDLAEINITPFIDVMLVLLIIFMVAAPLSTVDMPVALPKVSGTPERRPEDKVMVTLQRDLTVLVDGQTIASDQLAQVLAAKAGPSGDAPLFLGADEGVAYGELMALLNRLNAAGFKRVGLVGLEAVPAPATVQP